MLTVTSLSRHFGSRSAVADVSFDVAPGNSVGFLGPNGAGKTTTMRIITGIIDPDSGSVSWQGAPVTEAVRRRFGYMPEERGLYPKMRLGEQLTFMARLHGLSASAASADVAQLLEKLGLAERKGDRVDTLSHGNQQRAQLAAALVGSPDLLLLDEPYSGLDPAAVEEVATVIASHAARGAAVLFSSHQLDLVERFCKDVVIINEGRVVLSGDVATLRARETTRRYRVQIAGEPWEPALAGVEVVGRSGNAVVVVLDDDVRVSDLLDGARASGDVIEFTPVVASLADLFRDAVAPR